MQRTAAAPNRQCWTQTYDVICERVAMIKQRKYTTKMHFSLPSCSHLSDFFFFKSTFTLKCHFYFSHFPLTFKIPEEMSCLGKQPNLTESSLTGITGIILDPA